MSPAVSNQVRLSTLPTRKVGAMETLVTGNSFVDMTSPYDTVTPKSELPQKESMREVDQNTTHFYAYVSDCRLTSR